VKNGDDISIFARLFVVIVVCTACDTEFSLNDFVVNKSHELRNNNISTISITITKHSGIVSKADVRVDGVTIPGGWRHYGGSNLIDNAFGN
jgi:hypothetical protein